MQRTQLLNEVTWSSLIFTELYDEYELRFIWKI